MMEVASLTGRERMAIRGYTEELGLKMHRDTASEEEKTQKVFQNALYFFVHHCSKKFQNEHFLINNVPLRDDACAALTLVLEERLGFQIVYASLGAVKNAMNLLSWPWANKPEEEGYIRFLADILELRRPERVSKRESRELFFAWCEDVVKQKLECQALPKNGEELVDSCVQSEVKRSAAGVCSTLNQAAIHAVDQGISSTVFEKQGVFLELVYGIGASVGSSPKSVEAAARILQMKNPDSVLPQLLAKIRKTPVKALAEEIFHPSKCHTALSGLGIVAERKLRRVRGIKP